MIYRIHIKKIKYNFKLLNAIPRNRLRNNEIDFWTHENSIIFSFLVHENECVIRNFQHRKQNIFYYSLHYAVRTKIGNQSTITNEMKSSNIASHVVFQSSTSCALSGIWTNARMWNDSAWIQLLFTSGVWFLLLERTHGAICIFIAQTCTRMLCGWQVSNAMSDRSNIEVYFLFDSVEYRTYCGPQDRNQEEKIKFQARKSIVFEAWTTRQKPINFGVFGKLLCR